MRNFKLLAVFALALIIFAACENESSKVDQTYQISGEIRGVDSANVFLKVRGESGWETLDSATLNMGAFELSGQSKGVELVYFVSDAFRGGIPILLENTNYEISLHKDSIQDVQIKGSEAQMTYSDVKDKLDSFDESWQGFYYDTYRHMTDDEKAQNEAYLDSIYNGAQESKKQYLNEFITGQANNVASAQILMDNEDALGTDPMLSLYSLLSADVVASNPGQQLTKRVDIIKKTAIGQPIIDFTMNDTLGNPIKMSEAIQGKYVLVDFWAAWCGPCRRENPNVVENYNKYKDDGFTVFGVSFDEKKENWLKAIKDDGLSWMQVSDLKGWDNAAGKLYGIRSIPQNILVSPEGIIVEKNLRGEALGEKLMEIYGK